MSQYHLKQAELQDQEIAVNLIDEAKRFLKAQGIDQWQTGYPDKETIFEDIIHKRGYLITEGAQVLAYLCIDFQGEPAYENLKGKWESDLPYAVIHRMAISNTYRGRGLAGVIFQKAEALCRKKGISSIRVDTDEDNIIMRHILERNGFVHCGTVWFDNSIKHAYEKTAGR